MLLSRPFSLRPRGPQLWCKFRSKSGTNTGLSVLKGYGAKCLWCKSPITHPFPDTTAYKLLRWNVADDQARILPRARDQEPRRMAHVVSSRSFIISSQGRHRISCSAQGRSRLGTDLHVPVLEGRWARLVWCNSLISYQFQRAAVHIRPKVVYGQAGMSTYPCSRTKARGLYDASRSISLPKGRSAYLTRSKVAYDQARICTYPCSRAAALKAYVVWELLVTFSSQDAQFIPC